MMCSSALRPSHSPSASVGWRSSPLRFGAAATLLEQATPPNMVEIIETYKATVCFTAPTAYRAMMAAMDKGGGPFIAPRRSVGG